MSINLRLPNITAPSPEGKLMQMQSYLYQTVEQLNWALNNISTSGGNPVGAGGAVSSPGKGQDSAALTAFNELKALIIKSADIVNAYYEVINRRLSGVYVAQSDFGVFREETQALLEANSTAIDQFYSDLQEIITDIESVEHTLIEVNAHIRSGLLYYDDKGIPVYGLEIGQRSAVDGTEVFNKYARFTSDKLSFYDANDVEVAYISDRKLYISHVEITGTFTQGGFVDKLRADGSIVTRWIGGSA